MTNPGRHSAVQSPESRVQSPNRLLALSSKLFAICFPGLALAASAAPLAESASVHFRPDDRSAVVAVIPSGAEPVLTTDPLGNTPAGWMAVKFNGPFDGYVLNGDLTKTLDVKEGAVIRVAAAPDAPVLTTMQSGDRAEISGLRGRFTQVKVEKSIVGYLRTAAAVPGAVASAPPAPSAAAGATGSVPISVGGFATRDASVANSAVSTAPGTGELPRIFQGKFESTRRMFAPRRPYDYQLNDDSGARLAYLDLSRLMQTAQLDAYLERMVVIQGTARRVPELNAIVISVESLQLP